MSQLIPDNNVLLQFVPNVLKSVQGETLLLDKIAPHLEVAEAWLTTTFLSEAVLTELPTRDANNKLLHYARMAVVAEAIQTILRREAYPHPYEALKALTRTNEAITEERIHNFIEGLNVSDSVKAELRAITPHNYTGI